MLRYLSETTDEERLHVKRGTIDLLQRNLFFFCWRLLGLIPGGAPLSQLSSGVRRYARMHEVGKTSFYDKNSFNAT